MKHIYLFFIVLFTMTLSYGQVGINTETPKGTLDIVSIDNTGFILARVTQLEDVTDGAGNSPIEGTMIYDASRNSMCFYQNAKWICIEEDSEGNPILVDETPPTILASRSLQDLQKLFALGF